MNVGSARVSAPAGVRQQEKREGERLERKRESTRASASARESVHEQRHTLLALFVQDLVNGSASAHDINDLLHGNLDLTHELVHTHVVVLYVEHQDLGSENVRRNKGRGECLR